MRWQMGRRSSNIEDRRGMGLGGFKLGGCGLLLVILISLLTGQNPLTLISYLMQQEGGGPVTEAPREPGRTTPGTTQPKDEQADFVAVVLADTEDTWTQIFKGMKRSYDPPRLVLFDNMVQSACGTNSSAVGPFYCPLDGRVYIDLVFFRELSSRFGASGDFAQAYVIAHEVGHHVQNLLGISEQVHQARRGSRSETEANELSVRLELQADCFAGVWGHHADQQRQLLEEGDVEEGLNAAAAVGDDRLQEHAGRAISPESWTHGSSEMRQQWFTRGMQSGQFRSCNTFEGGSISLAQN